MLKTYSEQEGEAFNYHYSAHGYHPLLCYDGLTGNLLKADSRDGAAYSCNGVVDFMQPVLDEFFYQAASWEYPRRVVVKVEKPLNQLAYQHAFIVTNMALTPADILNFYCNRGTMENFIKECKNSFDFAAISSSCIYQKEFYETFANIRQMVQIE